MFPKQIRRSNDVSVSFTPPTPRPKVAKGEKYCNCKSIIQESKIKSYLVIINLLYNSVYPPPPPYNIILLIVINKFGSFLLTPPSSDLTPPYRGGRNWRKNERGNIQTLHSPPPPLLFLESCRKNGSEEKVGCGS